MSNNTDTPKKRKVSFSKGTIFTLLALQVISLILIVVHIHYLSNDALIAERKSSFKAGQRNMYETIARKTTIPEDVPRPNISIKGDMIGSSLGKDVSSIFYFYPALFLLLLTWLIIILHPSSGSSNKKELED